MTSQKIEKQYKTIISQTFGIRQKEIELNIENGIVEFWIGYLGQFPFKMKDGSIKDSIEFPISDPSILKEIEGFQV